MTAIDTTTTTTTTTSTRTGTGLQVTSQSNTVDIGNVVTDVSLQPYIAPRQIAFFAYNLRPSHRIHVFFDSINVDQYCAPGDTNTVYNFGIGDTSNPASIPKLGNWGDPIYTDDRGRVTGIFNVPASTFKTGDRILQLANVSDIAQGNAAIVTSASARFTASNLNVTKQKLTLTTINAEVSTVPISQTVVTTTTNVNITPLPDIYNVTAEWSEPIAQGLTINTPNGETGIFATSIDIFFKQKSLISQNGVTLYLCETNNGYPDGNSILPFSTTHLPYSSVNVSDDASVATRFTFESPVFLANGKEYAFIIIPDANDPDYFVFSANLGDTDLQTGYQVYQQPAVGTAFYGATKNEWTALQTEYFKFRLNRAEFNQSSGNAYFNNANNEYLTLLNINYSNTSVGLLPGDIVIQSTNSTVNTANVSINGILNYFDTQRGILYLDSSTGNFSSNSFIQVHRFPNTTAITTPGPNTSTLISTSNTGVFYTPIMDALVTQVATISPAGTTLNYAIKGTSNSYGIDSIETKTIPGYDIEFYDQQRVIYGKTTENSSMGGNKSLTLHATLTTDSSYVSPVIDTVRKQQLVLHNNVDPVDFNYEEFFNDGNSKSKYVSKIVTLADGQDAQDIRITLSAFRPPSSDIQVWVKFLNGEDTDPISQKSWTPLINSSGSLYSDPSNPSDMREFVFTVPKYYGMKPLTGSTTSSNSSTTVTGTGTLFQSELVNGWFVNMLANSTFNETTRKVVSITSNTSLTLDNPFNGNYTSQPMFLVPPPTVPYLSSNTTSSLSGTVSTYTTNNTIVGVGTNFTGELLPGSIILINGDQQAIVSIANSTILNVGRPWSSNNSGVTYSKISPTGVTYLNTQGSLYSTFKRFQVKIILQSNDSSKVPIIDDLQVLALQL